MNWQREIDGKSQTLMGVRLDDGEDTAAYQLNEQTSSGWTLIDLLDLDGLSIPEEERGDWLDWDTDECGAFPVELPTVAGGGWIPQEEE